MSSVERYYFIVTFVTATTLNHANFVHFCRFCWHFSEWSQRLPIWYIGW